MLFVVPFGGVLIAADVLAGTNPWENWENNYDRTWCEEPRLENLLREPANSLTAFLYYFVALYVLLCGTWDVCTPDERTAWVQMDEGEEMAQPLHCADYLPARRPSFSFLYGFCNVVHAGGVFINHACFGCTWGSRMDVSFMLGVIAFPTIYQLYLCIPVVSFGAKQRSTEPFFCGLYVVLEVVYFVNNFLRLPYIYTIAFAPMMLSDVVLTSAFYWWNRKRMILHGRLILVATASLILGIAIWYPEFNSTGRCILGTGPFTVVQGHALWHLLTATSLFLVYVYFRSMNKVSLTALSSTLLESETRLGASI